MSIKKCIILEIPTHSVKDSIYDLDWIFLEIPMKYCIVGMLLKCPIGRALELVGEKLKLAFWIQAWNFKEQITTDKTDL